MRVRTSSARSSTSCPARSRSPRSPIRRTAPTSTSRRRAATAWSTSASTTTTTATPRWTTRRRSSCRQATYTVDETTARRLGPGPHRLRHERRLDRVRERRHGRRQHRPGRRRFGRVHLRQRRARPRSSSRRRRLRTATPRRSTSIASYDADGFSLTDGESERRPAPASRATYSVVRDRPRRLGPDQRHLRRRQRPRCDRSRSGRDRHLHLQQHSSWPGSSPSSRPSPTAPRRPSRSIRAGAPGLQPPGRPARTTPASSIRAPTTSASCRPSAGSSSAPICVSDLGRSEGTSLNIDLSTRVRPSPAPSSTASSARSSSRSRPCPTATRPPSTSTPRGIPTAPTAGQLPAGGRRVGEHRPDVERRVQRVRDRPGRLGPDQRDVRRLGETPDDIDLDPGETVTCVFTNTKRGTIIVEKQTSPNGAEGDFDLHGDAAGTHRRRRARSSSSDLLPGTYTSTEARPGRGLEPGRHHLR